ncbi:DUF6629 family protein [Streptomyces sp. SID8352]|uniref:DUF6629 family protein n=1 Tax=Streptomyces sp. SID8352 TaxID=2690338 RepID=UPI00136CD3D6|nr:DUF6629 family protein [Streptomyces sp. SID8352]MYU26459.1 hypothetical protein [Streptomyces sp. SID8352]
MCWSPVADLAAGTAVAAVGVVCVARVRSPRDLPLAALPLLLGAHQIVEAALWHTGGGTGPATLAWAVIALPLLPLWVPAGVLLAATGPAVRRRLSLPMAAGAATAGVLAHALATGPVTADVRGRTVAYTLGLTHVPLIAAGYLLATVGALLLSGDRWLRALGWAAGAGAVVCWAVWRWAFVSTWCAVAAVCSLVLWGWVRSRPDRAPAEGGPGPR